MVCTDGVTIGMCLCVILAAIGTVCNWLTVYCVHLCGYYIITDISVSLSGWCIIIPLHPTSYNIARCGFCLTVLCLSDDPVHLIVYSCH